MLCTVVTNFKLNNQQSCWIVFFLLFLSSKTESQLRSDFILEESTMIEKYSTKD